MNVLVDTSVWVDHFRHGQPALARLLALDAVLIHPYVLAELACGSPPAPRGCVSSSLKISGWRM